MDALHTIDTENEVLSCRRQLDHAVGEASSEQQRKRKFKVTDLESEEEDDITAEMVKRFLSQMKSKKGSKAKSKGKVFSQEKDVDSDNDDEEDDDFQQTSKAQKGKSNKTAGKNNGARGRENQPSQSKSKSLPNLPLSLRQRSGQLKKQTS